MSRHTAKPDAWRLRQGDLPDERTIARERRLAGMDDNPVFRSILFQRHQPPRGGREWIALYVSMGLLTIILLMRGMGAGLIPYILVLPIMGAVLTVGVSTLYGTMRLFGFGQKREAGMIEEIPDQLAADMAHAAVSSEVFALGMWASDCTRQQVRRRNIVFGVAAVTLWAWMLIPPLAEGDPALTSIAIGGLVVVFWKAALTRRAPYYALAQQASQCKTSFKRIKGWLNPRLLFWLPVQVVLGICGFVVAIMLMAGLLIYIYETTYLFEIFDELFTGGRGYILAVAASAVGFWLGDIRGRYIRWRRERFLKQTIVHLDFILSYAHQTHIHPRSREKPDVIDVDEDDAEA